MLTWLKKLFRRNHLNEWQKPIDPLGSGLLGNEEENPFPESIDYFEPFIGTGNAIDTTPRTRCWRCGRVLTNPQSIENRIGRKCWEKERIQFETSNRHTSTLE